MRAVSIKINLLPPWERQERWPVSRLFVVSVLLVITCITVFTGFNFYKMYRLELDIAAAEQQVTLLLPTQQVMDAINLEQQASHAKTTLLTKLTTERKPWHAIISRLAVIVPPAVWLEELGGTGDKNNVKIKGNALTYPDLANFLQILEKDEMFAEPVLVHAEQDRQLAVTKFEVTVKIKGW